MGIVNVLLMSLQRFRPIVGRARRRPISDWLAGAGALVLLVLVGRHVEQRWSAPAEVAGFGEAIDGDSLKVAGKEIRLKGIDAPELAQWCQNRVGRDYACGVEAKRWLRTRLLRGAVICQIEGRDRYGRLLGICRRGDEVLNAAMVREGIAVNFGDYRDDERHAQRQQNGLWSGKFMMPAEFRAANPRN